MKYRFSPVFALAPRVSAWIFASCLTGAVMMACSTILVGCSVGLSEPKTGSSGLSTQPDPSGSASDSGSGSGSGNSSTSGTTDPTAAVTLSTEEAAFITLINAYRTQSGLSPLQVSVTLTQSSQWMSGDMATKNYFSHTDSKGRDPFTRMDDFGYSSNGYRGENIAAGNATAQATFTQWKNSPGHNANMLGANYKVIGVGRAAGGGSGYSWYWTTDFGSTVDKTL